MSRRADAGAETCQAHTGCGTGPVFFREWDDVGSYSWPLRTHLELAALSSAVPCARLHAKQVLWEWGLSHLAETVTLVVSELVTNSVHASKGLIGSRYNGQWSPGTPPVRMWLQSDRELVLIQVWDGNEQMPEVQQPEPDVEHGRGLFIVESLSDDYGAYPLERSSGKLVWALVSATQQLDTSLGRSVCR